MLLIGKNGTVEHVKRNGCESVLHYSHTYKHKHKDSPLTLHELNFRLNVIKRKTIFLLRKLLLMFTFSLRKIPE
jgi:hypothetical protein